MSANPPRVIVIMGVSGSGKSTISELLAERHHQGRYFDADDFHPPANVNKMAGGTPLDDDDRLPWLQRLRSEVIDPAPPGGLTLLACSALKRSYREILGLDREDVAAVYLHGHPETLLERMNSRGGHYMKSEMLDSQLDTLEIPSPDEALHVPITLTPEQITAFIERELFPEPEQEA